MSRLTALSFAAFASSLLVFTAAGCGGGTQASAAAAGSSLAADPADGSEAAQSLSPAQTRATLPATTELLDNGNFARGLAGWETTDVAVVASTLRTGGVALSIGGSAAQHLPATALVAGQSYRLLVTARLEQPGAPAPLAVRFRRPAGWEIIRSYPVAVNSTSFQTWRIDFTAPPYSDMPEVMLAAAPGTRVQVDSVSLAARTPIVQTQPVANNTGSFVPPGYVLAFNDEFNGATLDRRKWFTRYLPAGGTLDRLNDEQQRYRDNDNHRVANGVLSLVAHKVSSSDPAGINYESGMIRSDWTARYGYFEARVKMPHGVGMWPAFWLLPDVGAGGEMGWPPEIDIFEFVNNGVEDRLNMLHSNVVPLAGVPSVLSYADPAFNTDWTFYSAPYNFDEGWHTVGAQWTPDAVTMFLDGKRIYTRNYGWTFPSGAQAAPAHILLNLAVGGSWAGRHGIDDAALPQTLQIDWVRAYTPR